MSHEVSFQVDGRTIRLETGSIARQALAAVTVSSGDAVVLVTVVSAAAREDPGFLPLTVEYREKLAAAGRIPGAFGRREGRITDAEVLGSRILDRSLRPLFAPGFHDEVQVQASVLSADARSDEGPLLGLTGAAAALHLSPLPWKGPLGGLRVVREDGKWSAFPDRDLRSRADVDLVVASGPGGLVMVEGEARNVPDDEVLEGLFAAQEKIAACVAACEELRAKAGGPPRRTAEPGTTPADELRAWLEQEAVEALERALYVPAKRARRQGFQETKEALLAAAQERFAEQFAVDPRAFSKRAASLIDDLAHDRVRENLLHHGRRLDGRSPRDIRDIQCRVGWLPTPHGSAVFTRGETQALVTCTLASPDNALRVETLQGSETQQFFLHYNFPSYSVGEIRPLRGPGRREIGHGNLARRALLPVLPPHSSFPYAIRVESEITESNGSSSMATTCGGCLALMDAGVPIQQMVAGIAMGLISDGERFVVLSDILGDEDHLGDMDFKVAGTRTGVTALQMDNKIGSLAQDVLRQALHQAREGRLHILDRMQRTLAEPRSQPKEHAPRALPVRIAPAAIGDLIGPRGANIKEIQRACQAEISVDESGVVYVYAASAANAREAARRVQEVAGVLEKGRVYRGRVVTVKDFGAFVRIYRNAEGLVPVAEWDRGFVSSLPQVAREGDEVLVRVLGVDARGKIRLSRKEALDCGAEDVVNA